MKLALGIEYFGANFHGWQLQTANIRTVQQVVEKALSVVAAHPVRVFCAGRTDVGVHAIEQTIHFEASTKRQYRAWLLGGNANLPDDVSFKWVKQVDANFHARFSAIARQYYYKIHNTNTRSALLNKYSLWEPQRLDINAMSEAAQCLLGKHDFSAFRSSICQAKCPVKTIEHIRFTKYSHNIIIDIKANAFLHRMVRNIVGTLLEVGKGHKPIDWVKAILYSKERKCAGATTMPQGLYFVKAFYE